MRIVRPISDFCDTGRGTELCRQKQGMDFVQYHLIKLLDMRMLGFISSTTFDYK